MTSKRASVFLPAPVNLVIERNEMPSTIMPRTWARFSGGNLFTVRVLDLLCLVSSTLLLYEFVGLSRGGCSRIYRQDGGNGPLTFQVLTYMSIRGEIQSRIWEGELF